MRIPGTWWPKIDQISDVFIRSDPLLSDLTRFDLDREYYSKAAAAKPHHAVAHFNLGLLAHDEDVKTAVEHYRVQLLVVNDCQALNYL